MDSSSVSGNSRRASEPAACRLHWRRSRTMLAGLGVLVLAAAGSPWLADLPLTACVALGVAVAGYGGWLLWREWTRQPAELCWDPAADGWQITCTGRSETLRHRSLHLRGGIAVLVLAGDDGALRRYLWWPDTLDGDGRRALRLWLAAHVRAAAATASVA